MARNYTSAEAEDDFIHDNCDYHLAGVDARTGLHFYKDRSIVAGPSKAQKAAAKAKLAAEKAEKAAARARKAHLAPFKKDQKFARINKIVGHDEELHFAVLKFIDRDGHFEKLMSLSDEDMLAFAQMTAAHRRINSNDKAWHVMKDEIVARFGFRF